MATFSTNQVKHLYVAKALNNTLGTNGVVGDVKFSAAGDKDIVFSYVGADGIVRSDIINLDNIICAKAIKADTMSQYLDSSYVAVTTAAANQSYVLKVIIDSFSSLAEEDKGFIFAEYTAKSSDAAKDIIAGLAVNLAKNATKAAYNPLINVYVTTAATGNSLTSSNTWKVNAGDAQSTVVAHGNLIGLIVEAADQPWSLGKEAFNLLKFNVTTSPITVAGVDTQWATVTKGADHPSAAIVNSKKIADLEWFCMGERSDIYRGMGYPNNFEFAPQVDPAAQYGYHVLESAYYYAGGAEDVQKSPKEIVIVSPAASSSYNPLNTIIGTAASSAAAGTLNKAIYDSGSTAYVAQLTS